MTLHYPGYMPHDGDRIMTPDQHVMVGERMDLPRGNDTFHVTVNGEETTMHIDGISELLAADSVTLSRIPDTK